MARKLLENGEKGLGTVAKGKEFYMAKGSVRKKARSGTTAFTQKMKAADRYSSVQHAAERIMKKAGIHRDKSALIDLLYSYYSSFASAEALDRQTVYGGAADIADQPYVSLKTTHNQYRYIILSLL